MPGGSTAAAQFTVDLAAYDSTGAPLMPSASNPLYIRVYGAPPGVITPTEQALTSGTTATFSYNGGYFPNNMTVEAWIFDATAGIPSGQIGAVQGGYAMGVTQFIHQNRLVCASYGSQQFTLKPVNVPPQMFTINEQVGYAPPDPAQYKLYTIDTGSLGLLMPLAELPTPQPTPTAGGPVIGPGPAGVQYYDSSGNTFLGYYYLAPVTFQAQGGAVQTVPIEVLAVNQGCCMGPASKSCYHQPQPPAPILHYMGVGFNRESLVAGSQFSNPGQNAFINLTDADNGTDISQGYILSQNNDIKLGITSTTGFDTVTLDPSPTTPGEWNYIQGCFSFPNAAPGQNLCGDMLLDVGISYMFLGVPPSQIPQGTATTGADGNTYVPQNTLMAVAAPTASPFAMSYSFKMPSTGPAPVGSSTPTPTGPLPDFAQWVAPPATGGIFFNTGIAPLEGFDYLFDAQCGEVGFTPNH
jgi:hypothetical protein